MKKLPLLSPFDTVELIAPASRCSDEQLIQLKELLESWQLHCIIKEDIFASDLLCANTDIMRFQHLYDALHHPHSKAIICVRGGYGSMRLIPQLTTLNKPENPKIFIGMSDTTSLQLYFLQQWGWPVIHGSAAPDRFSKESIASLKSILFGEVSHVTFEVTSLNEAAQRNHTIQTSITGGNLTMIQAGIGTTWQIDGTNKMILLEEVGERGYRVDRMLEHLQQANIFKSAAALLFADFLGGNEPNGSSLIESVLHRFAANSTIPVVRIAGIGHGLTNFPIPCGTKAYLQLGDKTQLTVCVS